MPKAGDVYEMKNGGERTFLQTAEETNGELLEMEVLYPPEGSPPPAHFHPFQEERFEVLEGKLRVSLNNEVQLYEKGDKFTVPSGTVHWMHNASKAPTRVNWQVRPALKTGEFFEVTWQLSEKGRRADLLQTALLARAFRNEIRFPKPPYWLVMMVTAMLAPIARLMGYKLRYDSE